MNVSYIQFIYLCFGDLDADRLADCDDAFFGVPFWPLPTDLAFSELSEMSLELERMSPSICMAKKEEKKIGKIQIIDQN